jgi:hypothetical protein
MSEILPSENNFSNFYNINNCKSFNQTITTSLVALSSHSCSEVIIINKTTNPVYIYDSNNFGDNNRLLIDTGESIALRGVTNSSQISAKTSTGSGVLYYRTQSFSFLPQQ